MNIKDRKRLSSFRRISLLTTIAIYFLILVGGIVRSTGSGMGCPDWPKCFGSWIPPTSVDQLPNNYLDVYLAQRMEKNERFAQLLSTIGFGDLGRQILEDESVSIEGPFNATKTWIEYVNRLIGALVGVLVLLTVYRAFLLWNKYRSLTYLSIVALVLVLFQGWIGSIVVSTNLLQWMITVHMLLALLIVCLLLYIFHRASVLLNPVSFYLGKKRPLQYVVLSCMVLMVVQIVLGTQVREEIDSLSRQLSGAFRETWIDGLGVTFLVHRSYSIVILAMHILLGYLVYKEKGNPSSLARLMVYLLAVIVLEIITGAGMAYFGLPAFLQPLHLLFGTLIVGIQFLVWLEIGHQKNSIKEKSFLILQK